MADKYVVGLFQQLEQEVIGDIARRVKKTGRYTETAELMAKSMIENGYSAEKIRADVMRNMRADKALQDEIAKNTLEYKQFVTDEIKATVKAAKEEGNNLVSEAGMMAYNNDLSMWKQAGKDLTKPNSLTQIMNAFKLQTANELRNLTKTTGFKGTVLTPVMSAYQREMDMALVKLATGTFSYDQIVNDCVRNLAKSGLRSIDYASGRSMQLDTAARLSVRTGLSQLSGKITEANIESAGVDLVITSQHMGSRPEHAVWQNKVFSYKGKSKKYPDFVKSTGYGTVTGLKGANCSHDFYPYWEGISIREPDLKEPAPVTVNGKEYDYYQATQKQRSMERNIRATKREIEAQRVICGDTSALQAKLRKQSADYHNFSNAVGIRAKDNRLKVVSGSSDLNKTKIIQTYNNTVQDSTKNGIINLSREKYVSGKYATSNEVISDICRKELSGVKLSHEVVYNGRIRTQGLTNATISTLGKVTINKIEIGKQAFDTRECIIDSILHEELEARIMVRAKDNKFYSKLNAAREKERHEYINKVIERYFEGKGLDYAATKGLVRR